MRLLERPPHEQEEEEDDDEEGSSRKVTGDRYSQGLDRIRNGIGGSDYDEDEDEDEDEESDRLDVHRGSRPLPRFAATNGAAAGGLHRLPWRWAQESYHHSEESRGGSLRRREGERGEARLSTSSSTAPLLISQLLLRSFECMAR